MVFAIRTVLRQLLRYAGLDIVKWHKVPENTLLGVAEYDINTVLDIGANTGKSARFYRQVFPNARIYSFEPLPAVYSKLNEWAKRDGKAQAINVALGDAKGVVTMNEHVDFSPSSSLLERTRHSVALFPQTSRQSNVQVNMARLDDVIQDLEIKQQILVKMDVQGFEDKVIEGGKAVLSLSAACIMEVSLQPLYEGQPTFKNLCHRMDGLGFEYAGNLLQIYDVKGQVIYLDALFRKPVTF